MNNCMAFPETLEEFLEQYQFKDAEEIYTNGSMLIPVFRVKQWAEHYAANVVEVVRCRDCIFRSNEWTGCPKLNGTITDDEFFCKCGEKREES